MSIEYCEQCDEAFCSDCDACGYCESCDLTYCESCTEEFNSDNICFDCSHPEEDRDAQLTDERQEAKGEPK